LIATSCALSCPTSKTTRSPSITDMAMQGRPAAAAERLGGRGSRDAKRYFRASCPPIPEAA
jgi:hypothetical protein